MVPFLFDGCLFIFLKLSKKTLIADVSCYNSCAAIRKYHAIPQRATVTGETFRFVVNMFFCMHHVNALNLCRNFWQVRLNGSQENLSIDYR